MFDLKLISKFVLLAVILRQQFNNFSTSTQASIILPLRHDRKQTHRYVIVDSIPMVNAPVPSPFPRKIYCDITKSIVLNPCRCIACRLLALAQMHLIGLSKVPTAILQGVQKHWGERVVTNGAHNIYY